ncbi:hypothetical protein M885DRAFT_498171 [Pelagophyceae sp. CCMP2097]|nr:hypothetical protein M885DRAFT_498171 [Pelagophyceae sp. CCMP2097]
MTACSADHENAPFLLVATAGESTLASPPLRVMRLRLAVEEAGAWEDVWFKDEGGREKCITLLARLEDAAGTLITHRSAKLGVVLHYADSLFPVMNQEILRLVGTESNDDLKLDKGVCRIRIRIEDVSKNHQGQSFMVQVKPESGTADVAHGFSKGVAVRSKRNKRQAAPGGRAQHAPQRTAARQPPPFAKHGKPDYGAPRPAQRPRQPDAAVSPWLTTARADASLNAAVVAISTSAVWKAQRAQAEWISACKDSLRQLKWRVIGTEVLPSGEKRHVYEMHNPNTLVDELLRTFEVSVAPVQRQLEQSVEALPQGRALLNGSREAPPPPLAMQDGDRSPKRLRRSTHAKAVNYAQMDTGNEDDDEDEDEEEDEEDHAGEAEIRHAGEAEIALLRPEPTLSALARQRTSVAGVYDILSQLPSLSSLSPGNGQFNRFPSITFDVNQDLIQAETSAADALSSLAPPMLQRGVSSLYVGDDVPKATLDLVAAAAARRGGPPPNVAEQSVALVVAKRFKPPRFHGAVALGFPAFDAEHRLVGLYREQQLGHETAIVFVPRDDASAGLDLPGDADVAETALRHELRQQSDSIQRLEQHQTHDKLKESAAIYHWSKEALLNLPDANQPLQE